MPEPVSPADTIRQAGEYIAAAVDGGPRDFEWLIRVFDAAHALLAVGERDKAERERDRRQIARLTEALRDALAAYDLADRHIREELQPEFERLGEPRLASWWHGCHEGVDAARAVQDAAPPLTEEDYARAINGMPEKLDSEGDTP